MYREIDEELHKKANEYVKRIDNIQKDTQRKHERQKANRKENVKAVIKKVLRILL